MNWLEAIQARHSTRRYSEQAVADKTLEQLLATAKQVAPPVEAGVRLALVSGREQVGRILGRLAGLYGLVEGAPHLLVGLLAADTELARLELGYVAEHVVLEATRLGIASCWMTGSYRPRVAAEEVAREEEVVAAAIALGYPRQDKMARIHDSAVRRLVAAHRRRPLEEIVFAGRWAVPWQRQEAEPALVTMLEHARLAPSAHNGQPWRFIVTAEELVLALAHPTPIDGGIVMAHVTLAAQEVGQGNCWTVRWGDAALAAALGLPRSAVIAGAFPLGKGTSAGTAH